jgi:hypothetical protein
VTQSGPVLATTSVAEYELACGDARAAVSLLSELDEKPALLATAQAQAAAQATRHQQLEALGRDADPTISRATRLIIVPLCIAFVVFPLFSALNPSLGLKSHFATIAWAAGFLLGLVLISLVVRKRAMTAINRRIFSAAQFLFFSQTVLAVGVWQLGLSSHHTQVLNLFMWGAISGMFALAIDRWLIVVTVGYFAAFLVAAQLPEHRMFAVTGGNLVLALAVAWRWRARR